MKSLEGVVHLYQYAAYEVMQKYLQKEWYFLQRVIPRVGVELYPVDETLRRDFLLVFSMRQNHKYQIRRSPDFS